MKIGFDIDGVLADFSGAYQKRMIEVSGKDLFCAGDAENPPTWNWDLLRGYTKQDRRAVWDSINADPFFWSHLNPLPGVHSITKRIRTLQHHDLYFITNRLLGIGSKRQTEHWLQMFVRTPYPTVILTQTDKSALCGALHLDAFVDDKRDNIIAVASSMQTRSYLLDRRYNQDPEGPMPPFTRILSLEDFFYTEKL